MMPVLELYGRCRAVGYCDCGGSNGCVDEEMKNISKQAVVKRRRGRAGMNIKKLPGK